MKSKTVLLSFVFLLVISSCVSYEKFSIEVYKPSDFGLKGDVKKVALISRNLKYVNDTLQNYQVRNHRLISDKILFNTDSLAIRTCLDSLSTKMLMYNKFDSIWVLPVNTFSARRVKEIRPAKSDWYEAITATTGADALILLDMFSCFYTMNNDNSRPLANVVTSNIWTVYQAKERKIVDRFSQVDTLYWEEADENGQYKKMRIPDKRNAVSLAAGVIGENYAKHILPAWAKVDRNFMLTGNPDLQKAVKLAQNNKWEEASEIWQVKSRSNSKLDKVVALYNLALASEMNGDTDRAIELTSQAAKASGGLFMSSVNEAVRRYSVILYQRKIEINKLNSQHETR